MVDVTSLGLSIFSFAEKLFCTMCGSADTGQTSPSPLSVHYDQFLQTSTQEA